MLQPMRVSEGGAGGVVVCLGVGGLVDLGQILRFEQDDSGSVETDGIEVWVFDARRPYNLANVFGSIMQRQNADEAIQKTLAGVNQGQITKTFKTATGGIIVWDDGDIQDEMEPQRAAHFALERMRGDVQQMEDIIEDAAGSDSDSDRGSQTSSSHVSAGKKRKSWELDADGSDSEKENIRPGQRRRGNDVSMMKPSTDQFNLQTFKSSSLPSSPRSRLAPPSNQLSSQPEEDDPVPRRPSRRQQRRAFLRERQKHIATIEAYHTLGTSYSEPVSSLMYSLASELGREDNDLLWFAIVGVSSTELYGRTPTGVSLTNHDRDFEVPVGSFGWTGSRGFRIRQLLRDEVRRLNPPELNELGQEITRGHATDAIQTHAKSPTDTAIRLSPEPRFLLIRHWSLYESMLHSPYLSARLHVWSDAGRRRLHKLLAKMGVSLTQSKQNYTHMDMQLKKVLRERLLHVAPMYGLDGLVPPSSMGSGKNGDKEGWGFVRSWGWKACLSAADVAVLLGAVLDVDRSRLSTLPHTHNTGSSQSQEQQDKVSHSEDARMRFYAAYDALASPSNLMSAVPVAQSLHRSILRTGTSLLQKRQIKNLRAFRMGLVKEGPDVGLFCSPGALTKLALWLGEAVAEVEPERNGDDGKGTKSKKPFTPLVLGCLEEDRDVYIVVGLGGGGSNGFRDQASRKQKQELREKKAREREKLREAKRKEKQRRRAEREDEEEDEETEEESEDDTSSEEEDEDDTDPKNRNKFGVAFSEAAMETNARVKQDSFEHCVIEVKKEDLSGFLEHLSQKAVVG